MSEQSSDDENTFDFKDGNGPVPAHRHDSGGGWVANSASVSREAYVGTNARVFGRARVHIGVRLRDDVQVCGKAIVSGYILLFGSIKVYGETRLFGNMEMSGLHRINKTPVYVEGLFPWPACFVTSPSDVVTIGCETHPLEDWRRRGGYIARKYNVPRGSLAKLMHLLDVVYGKQQVPRKRCTK